MILVTGGCGLIGSNIIQALNQNGIDDILVADEFDGSPKWRNLLCKQIIDYVDKDQLFERIAEYNIEAVVHMGACTDTMEHDGKKMMEVNFEFSKRLWKYCVQNKVKFIYASSASVYGDGSSGYAEHVNLNKLTPLNPYAFSKYLFDRWVAVQKECPPAWAGLRFFNVYGPGEEHKNHMASMVFHAYQQIRKEGKVKLFKSYNEKYHDGEQKRDFIYVKDIAQVILFLQTQSSFPCGIYNLGTGKARSFNDLAQAVFSSLDMPSQIEYVQMPELLKKQYQYFTEADMRKLRSIGYERRFTELEQGVSEYVEYLNFPFTEYGKTKE